MFAPHFQLGFFCRPSSQTRVFVGHYFSLFIYITAKQKQTISILKRYDIIRLCKRNIQST